VPLTSGFFHALSTILPWTLETFLFSMSSYRGVENLWRGNTREGTHRKGQGGFLGMKHSSLLSQHGAG
jgi:hypothetical protein